MVFMFTVEFLKLFLVYIIQAFINYTIGTYLIILFFLRSIDLFLFLTIVMVKLYTYSNLQLN